MARRDTRPDPKEALVCPGPLPEPPPRAGHRPGVPGQRLLRRPRRGAGQVRDGAQGQGRRRPGHRGRRGVRRPRPAYYAAAAALESAGLDGLVPARPGPRGASKLTEEILAWAEEQRPRAPRCARRSCRTGSRRPSACACTPGQSSERWPAAGSATPKAADLPVPARKEDDPSLSLLPSPGHAAAEPGARRDAGQDSAPGGVLDARYEQLRHAALHARAEAFPLGLGVLTGKGVTAWRHALAGLTSARQQDRAAPAFRPPGTQPAPASGLPSPWPPSSSAPWRPSRSQVADIGQSMAVLGKFELHEQIKRGFTERGQLLRLLDNYEDRDDLIAWIRERGSAERGRYLGNVTASSGLVMPRLRAVMRKWSPASAGRASWSPVTTREVRQTRECQGLPTRRSPRPAGSARSRRRSRWSPPGCLEDCAEYSGCARGHAVALGTFVKQRVNC